MKQSPTSDWKTVYERYRWLERELGGTEGHQSPKLLLLRWAIKAPAYLESELQKYRNADLPVPSSDLLAEINYLASLKQDRYLDSGPYEDVYHLAFHHVTQWPSTKPTPGLDKYLYRGQRSEDWQLTASIFRALPSPGTGSARIVEVQRRAANACAIGRLLSHELSCSHAEAMAIAQHYSAELGVATWMLDFSYDPWTALYFASLNGKEGEIGVVWSIAHREFHEFTDGDANPIGRVEFCEPHGISRITAQSGIFVKASLPLFFEQYVPFRLGTSFRQKTGLVFEDAHLSITQQQLFPRDEQVIALIDRLRRRLGDYRCGCLSDTCNIPQTIFSDPLAPNTYATILDSWCEVRFTERVERETLSQIRDQLPLLAHFHALLQTDQARDVLRPLFRSWSRLEEALVELFNQAWEGRSIDCQSAIRSGYRIDQGLPIIDEAEHNYLIKSLQEVAKHL